MSRNTIPSLKLIDKSSRSSILLFRWTSFLCSLVRRFKLISRRLTFQFRNPFIFPSLRTNLSRRTRMLCSLRSCLISFAWSIMFSMDGIWQIQCLWSPMPMLPTWYMDRSTLKVRAYEGRTAKNGSRRNLPNRIGITPMGCMARPLLDMRFLTFHRSIHIMYAFRRIQIQRLLSFCPRYALRF
jgi:hypothetical protein